VNVPEVPILHRLLGARPLEPLARWATGDRLRVLAYHRVGDGDRFEDHVRHLVRRYRPVSAADVAGAVHGRAALPDRAVWITFDDGCVDVVRTGLDILTRRSVPATAFVCPGLIEAGAPYWWDVVVEALGPVDGPSAVLRLQRTPDADRRREVAVLLADRPAEAAVGEQLRPDEVRRWAASGLEVGNHTWDHPALDQCDDGAVEDQIRRAHDWLADLLGTPTRWFAYPNGHAPPAARRVFRELGYELAVAYDHRLAARRPDPLSLSRLAVEGDDDPARLRSVVAGLQPTLLGAARRALRTGT